MWPGLGFDGVFGVFGTAAGVWGCADVAFEDDDSCLRKILEMIHLALDQGGRLARAWKG
jgi:hypothetical protein